MWSGGGALSRGCTEAAQAHFLSSFSFRKSLTSFSTSISSAAGAGAAAAGLASDLAGDKSEGTVVPIASVARVVTAICAWLETVPTQHLLKQ